jgi:non-ribosomal peptide synthetase component F
VTRLLQDLVARRAARRPEATAIVYGAKRLSYGELDAAANRLARALVEAGCRKGDRVCFLYPKKPAAMVWMLGILKAGAMHVPLDLASPAERLRRIVRRRSAPRSRSRTWRENFRVKLRAGRRPTIRPTYCLPPARRACRKAW